MALSSDEDDFLDRLSRVVVNIHKNHRAPNKPLLLLLALGRVTDGRERLAAYTEIEKPLKKLLAEFGPPRKTIHPEQPFGHLRTDGLWEIPGDSILPASSSGTLLVGGLREHSAKGGFPEDIFQLLKQNPGIVHNAAQLILERHFPHTLHDRIRAACNLPAAREKYPARGSKRDRAFRTDVLSAYGDCCAACGYDLRLNEVVFGIEAAHIKWHSQSGPDIVPNGLALCSLHHVALDSGALGLRQSDDDEVVSLLVSSGVSGGEAALRLRNLHGAVLRQPESKEFLPRKEFVEWHRKEVFRGPTISIDAER